ncbi:MAG: ABC transporter permease [Candidatus Staskawiczbacteria bacterium]|jgi:putative ABC transport system permease protein
MDFLGTIKLVFKTLLARKGRSFLTILGIVIGVAGVIIIISLGAGAQSLILGQITKLGSNLLSVQPGKSNENGPPAQVFGITITTLINEDADALRNKSQVPHAEAVVGMVMGSVSVTWQNKTIDTNFIGTDYNFPNVLNTSIQSGQFFDQSQGEGGANVVVLGYSVASQLFDNTGIEPVGQVIKVRSSTQEKAGGIPLRVVGVMAEKGSAIFLDFDDQVYLPLTIGQQQILGVRYLRVIDVKVDSPENIDQTIIDIENVINQRHRIIKDSDADYTVRNMADAIDILSTITDALRLFLTAMAAIALIVGGIGILNIMLATVAERTREIGLRKAVGATNKAVMRQFLIEAGVLTFLGGIIGIIIGVIISYIASLIMQYLGYDWAFVISLWSVLVAIGVSVLTGVIFGLYPALKASKLNPIDALRYE